MGELGQKNASGGERSRIFASRFAADAKCVLCLRLPLEGDFGMQNTVHDLFLGLGCLVGDSLRAHDQFMRTLD